MTDGLFDMPTTPVVEEPKLSPDRRRTQRQAEAITRGLHPLTLIAATVRRHPETVGQDYAATDPKGRGLTCGTCVFRQVQNCHGRSYAKCVADGERRVSNGAATDLRSWWPACSDWEPLE